MISLADKLRKQFSSYGPARGIKESDVPSADKILAEIARQPVGDNVDTLVRVRDANATSFANCITFFQQVIDLGKDTDPETCKRVVVVAERLMEGIAAFRSTVLLLDWASVSVSVPAPASGDGSSTAVPVTGAVPMAATGAVPITTTPTTATTTTTSLSSSSASPSACPSRPWPTKRSKSVLEKERSYVTAIGILAAVQAHNAESHLSLKRELSNAAAERASAPGRQLSPKAQAELVAAMEARANAEFAAEVRAVCKQAVSRLRAHEDAIERYLSDLEDVLNAARGEGPDGRSEVEPEVETGRSL